VIDVGRAFRAPRRPRHCPPHDLFEETQVSRLRLKAEPRDTFGKGASRRVRREGRIPAVIYGGGTQLRHVSVDAKELTLALRKAGVVLEIETDSGTVITAPRDVQRDPVKRSIEHVDLVIVNEAEARAVEAEAAAAAADAVARMAAAEASAEAAADREAARDAAGVAEGAEAGGGAEGAADSGDAETASNSDQG
jgi:large subunit ribosomal protein L25